MTPEEKFSQWLKDAEYLKRRYNSLPWRTSVHGHTTSVYPLIPGGTPWVHSGCHRMEHYAPGSWHSLYVLTDWMETVYDVGGFKGYFSGRIDFVLGATCIGLIHDAVLSPVYRVTVVKRDRGTRVTTKTYNSGRPFRNPEHRDGWHWGRVGKDNRVKSMPPSIVADYLQDHDHVRWTDEKVTHLRGCGWFSPGDEQNGGA